MRLRDLMTSRFSIIEESSSVEEARSKLKVNDYVVVTDQEGNPLTVITGEDLPRRRSNRPINFKRRTAKLPPTVIIGSDLEMFSIAESPTQYLFNRGARGAVIIGDEGIEGVLPAEVMKAYMEGLRSRYGKKGSKVSRLIEAGQTASTRGIGLGGRRRPPSVPRTCTFLGCGWSDIYPYILITTKCKNPNLPEHILGA